MYSATGSICIVFLDISTIFVKYLLKYSFVKFSDLPHVNVVAYNIWQTILGVFIYYMLDICVDLFVKYVWNICVVIFVKYVWKFYVTFVQLYLWIMCEIFVWYLFKCTWVKCIPLICPLCTLQRIIYGAIFSEYCHINYPQMKQTGSKGRLKIQIQI